jgi:hypothetical protein
MHLHVKISRNVGHAQKAGDAQSGEDVLRAETVTVDSVFYRRVVKTVLFTETQPRLEVYSQNDGPEQLQLLLPKLLLRRV